MKLLHIHDFFGIGNSRYGHDMCRLLISKGHKVHILAGVGKNGPYDGETIDGITFHTYPYGFNLKGLVFLWYALSKNKTIFEKIHQKIHFDILIFNQPLCFYGVTRSRFTKKIPKVYSFISPWGLEWAIANTIGVNKSLPCKICKKFNIKIRNSLEEEALRKSDAIMVISNFMKNQLLKNHPTIPEEKLYIIPGAVDINRFTTNKISDTLNRESLGTKTDELVILTVRRLVPRMGLENLIRAMPEILKSLPNAILLIGGEGPLRQSLEQLASSTGCKDKIKFLGYVKEENLPSLYRLANLFVLPTRDLEGFGLVAIESMACGTPVMGTPVGAIPEVLAPFDKNMLFSGITPSEIANGIIHFFKSNKATEDLKKRCKEYVVTHYAWDSIIDKIENLLLNAVNITKK